VPDVVHLHSRNAEGPDDGAARADSLAAFAERLRKFRDERDWQRFHTPRNLAVSIAIETAELLEHFQWVDDETIYTTVEEHRDAIGQELADVAIYLIQLSDVIGISLGKEIDSKIEVNAGHYPVEKARGSAAKHTEIEVRKVGDPG
jgi:NTP pyrophosphatase (non-canonical NTP hydrolase)